MSRGVHPQQRVFPSPHIPSAEVAGGKGASSPEPRIPHRKENLPFWLRIAVWLLCLLILLAGTYFQHALPERTSLAPATGPFVQVPFTNRQVDALHHLAKRMSPQTLADLYLSRMTLDQKLGQLFIAQYWGYSYSDDVETMVRDLFVGGVIVYGAQMTSFQQAKDDIANMQRHAWMPLFIAADEEGGFVERIQNVYGHRPGALETYKTGQVSKAAKLGQSIAHDLRSLGINTDLAPDVDVPLAASPDLYSRTWGYTPESVMTYGGAYLRALQETGEIGCLKHFPGLGAARTNAHLSLPVVNRSREEITSVELAPFKHFIQSPDRLENPGMIMSTDVLMPAIDPQFPAELSPFFITNILRKQLGYAGVVITDALYMKGISNRWSLPKAVVLALQAGNDMILGAVGSTQVQEAITGIKEALATGQLSQARIDEAVKRIVILKLSTHLWPSPEFSPI